MRYLETISLNMMYHIVFLYAYFDHRVFHFLRHLHEINYFLKVIALFHLIRLHIKSYSSKAKLRSLYPLTNL